LNTPERISRRISGLGFFWGGRLCLNFPPGLITGFLLRWRPLPAVLLGGVTYISSSGIIAKVLAELKRLNNPETPSIVSCS